MKSKFYVVVILLGLYITGCKSPEKINWGFSENDIILPLQNIPETIEVDLYLDATTSMKGFSAITNSNYGKFLDAIEASSVDSWKKTSINFFKFGTYSRKISRNEFLSATSNQSFYNESGMFEKTNIDSVINRTNIKKVSIVVTDLFQSEGDVNSIVKEIKEKCFSRGVDIAVLGILSEFKGKVYDTKNPAYNFVSKTNDLKSYRPFYALMFGDPVNLNHLYESLSTQPFINRDYFILISNQIINSYSTSIQKDKKEKGFNKKSNPNSNSQPNHYMFSMDNDKDQANIVADFEIEKNNNSPIINYNNLELACYKKVVTENEKNKKQIIDSLFCRDISISEIKTKGSKINCKLNLKLPGAAGTYSYLVYLQTKKISGLSVPNWIKELSSENPSTQKDANKTLNLEKFISDLITANSSIDQPKVAKFYMTIYKK